MKTYITSLITCGLISISSLAQNQSSIHLSINAPLSKYGAGFDDFLTDGSFPNDDLGYAGTGIGFGYTFRHYLNDKGLLLSCEANLLWNPLKSDVRDLFIEDDENSYRLPHFIHIPVLVGIGYERSVNDNISLRASASPLFNIMSITDSKHTETDNSPKI